MNPEGNNNGFTKNLLTKKNDSETDINISIFSPAVLPFPSRAIIREEIRHKALPVDPAMSEGTEPAL
jgi:hypothetical protein